MPCLIDSILKIDDINQYIEPNQLLPGTNKWSLIQQQQLNDIILVRKYVNCLYISNYDFNYMNCSSLENYKKAIEVVICGINNLAYEIIESNIENVYCM